MNNANYVFNVIVKENGKEEQMKAQKIVRHTLTMHERRRKKSSAGT
jgi:hypothetical protein